MASRKSEFFTVCENDGCIEWIETVNDVERINELTRTGLMKFPWKMNINVYIIFSEAKYGTKRFVQKKTRINDEDYGEDIFCVNCEKRLNPIPFSEIDKEQRMDIFKMTGEERIQFAKSWKMLKVIEEK